MIINVSSESELLSNNVYNFSSNINILVGQNGAGKSALLKAIVLKHTDNWELRNNYRLTDENLTIDNLSTDLGYYIAENNSKHKGYFGDDVLTQVIAMKASSGESTLHQVLNVLKHQLVILDEPDQSLDIKNMLILEEVFKKIASNGTKIIMTIHNPFLLKEMEKVPGVTFFDIYTGDKISIESYFDKQKEAALEIFASFAARS